MKEKVFCTFILLLCLSSCKVQTEDYDSIVEMIPVNLKKSQSFPIEEIIDRIEIIPLETNDDCIVHMYKKLIYIKELEMFYFFDSKYNVYLFSKEGKFISNSEHVIGQGPQQVLMVVDFLYNPFSKCMEFLDLWGTIFRYDTSFKFIEKIKLDQKKLTFHRFEPLSANKYLLAYFPSFLSECVLHFCDFEDKKVEKSVFYIKHFIGGPVMQNHFFIRFNDDFLFTPLGFDYHFYQIDANSMTLTPVIKLDFGSDEITRKQIESMTGFSYREESKKSQWTKKTDMIEISDALIKSSLHIPIVKLINDKYVYLHILSDHKRSNYIYNRITKKGYYQAANDSFKIYFGLQMEDNVLITMPQPYEIEEYIDKKLMSQEDIQKFDNIKEDDNPVIVKYYFK